MMSGACFKRRHPTPKKKKNPKRERSVANGIIEMPNFDGLPRACRHSSMALVRTSLNKSVYDLFGQI